jgi:hypothetical protein
MNQKHTKMKEVKSFYNQEIQDRNLQKNKKK